MPNRRLLFGNNYGGSRGVYPPVRANLALQLDYRRSVDSTTAAFAGAGTLTIATTAVTFTTSQDGAIVPGDTIITNGHAYTIGARSSGTAWAVSPSGTEAALSTFTITKQAPRVSAWHDLSGNAADWSKATGTNQPLLTATGLLFDGIDDRLDGGTPALALGQNVPGLTIFTVKSITGLGVAGNILQLRIGSGSTSRVVIGPASSNKWQFQAVRLDADVLATLAGGNTMTTARDVVTHLLDYGNTAATRWINGTQDVTNAAFLTAGNSSNTASTSAFIGSLGGSGFLAGTLQAILIYQRVLSSSERHAVERWLGQQFTVAVA
ncbi:MAG TPA: hypothetical protein VGI97_14750 [Gemmatimonadaceae bacterium]|jgi:hypothetical protein